MHTQTPHRPTHNKPRPNEGKKGQNQDNRAKFRNTFSSVYVSLGNKFLDQYKWDNCTLLRYLLVSCCLSNDDNLDWALYNEGHRCPGEGLNIDLLISSHSLSFWCSWRCAFSSTSSLSLNIMTKSRKTREAVISEPFLDRLFSNLDGVAVVQDFYSILPSFHIVLCSPLISCFLLLDHNNNNNKLIQ